MTYEGVLDYYLKHHGNKEKQEYRPTAEKCSGIVSLDESEKKSEIIDMFASGFSLDYLCEKYKMQPEHLLDIIREELLSEQI